VLEELSGIRTAAADPWLEEYERTSGNALLSHQDEAIGAAEKQVAGVPGHSGGVRTT
jgi:hypothetical protein